MLLQLDVILMKFQITCVCRNVITFASYYFVAMIIEFRTIIIRVIYMFVVCAMIWKKFRYQIVVCVMIWKKI